MREEDRDRPPLDEGRLQLDGSTPDLPGGRLDIIGLGVNMEGRKQVTENGRRRANPTCSLETTGDRSTGAEGESRYGSYAIGDHLR